MADADQLPVGSLSPLPYARQAIDASDVEAVLAALGADFLTQGPRVAWFEDALREVTGARYAVAVSSGTAALHLACLGLGVGPGDVGVVPAITFAATANCVRYVGGKVAFCDVDAASALAGTEGFRAALAGAEALGRARVVLPVSFAGSVPDLEGISRLAAEQGLFVIEDAAHSIGASYGAEGGVFGSGSCRHSDAATLSFHPVKHVCAGEGGAVLTNDETLARRARSLRSHGIEKGEGWLYNQTELGFNYRLTDVQAALGRSQLARLGENVRRRRELVGRYRAALAEGRFAGRILAPPVDELSAWHLFVVRFAGGAAERAAAYRFLHERGIRAQVHYLPVYRHDAHRAAAPVDLPGAEAFYAGCLSLPLFPGLRDEEQDRVLATLGAFLESRAG